MRDGPPFPLRLLPVLLALVLCGTVFGEKPDDGRIVQQAEALLQKHRADEAAGLLQRRLAVHRDDVNALVLLARIDAGRGDAAGAKELLGRALGLRPDALAAHTALGELLLKEGREPEAMDRFETVLAVDPKDEEARRGELEAVTKLAVSARKADRPDAALKALEHARGKLVNDPQLLFELGVQATELGNLPEAQQALSEARKLDESNLDVLYALARVEIEEQQMPEAQADLRAYLAKRPGDATAHYGLGHVLAMEQRKEDARAEFERSIQLQPVQTESYYQLGQIALELQHDAQAGPLFQKVLARDPEHGGALTGVGILKLRVKDYGAAEEYLTHAAKAAPEYQPAHYYLGLVLAKLGRKEESRRELELATQLDRKQQGPPGVPTGSAGGEMTTTSPR